MSGIQPDDNEVQAASPQDAFERRALLLHFGDVVESIGCVLKCAERYRTVSEALANEDSLAGFPILGFVASNLTPQDFAARAASSFFLWTKGLLEATLNRKLLTHTVQHDLFAGNQAGWDRYVEMMRADVPWFGEGLGPVTDEDVEPERTAIWPPAQTAQTDATVPSNPVEAIS